MALVKGTLSVGSAEVQSFAGSSKSSESVQLAGMRWREGVRGRVVDSYRIIESNRASRETERILRIEGRGGRAVVFSSYL